MRALALGLLIFAASCAPALADMPCPAKSLSYDDRIDAISAAPNCSQAADIMSACLFVASGDVGLAAAVEKKCEPTFLSKLSPAQRRRYSEAGARCLSKYADREGTFMSRSPRPARRRLNRYARKYGTR